MNLHDTEHAMWIRAKDMNRTEKELLRSMLGDYGVANQLLNVDIIKPVAPTACLRVSRHMV